MLSVHRLYESVALSPQCTAGGDLAQKHIREPIFCVEGSGYIGSSIHSDETCSPSAYTCCAISNATYTHRLSSREPEYTD